MFFLRLEQNCVLINTLCSAGLDDSTVPDCVLMKCRIVCI